MPNRPGPVRSVLGKANPPGTTLGRRHKGTELRRFGLTTWMQVPSLAATSPASSI